jgi:hypothetical protein
MSPSHSRKGGARYRYYVLVGPHPRPAGVRRVGWMGCPLQRSRRSLWMRSAAISAAMRPSTYDDLAGPSSRQASKLPWKADFRTGVASLFDAPVAWSRQHHMLGLAL